MQCILPQYVANTVQVIVFGFGTLQAFCSVQVFEFETCKITTQFSDIDMADMIPNHADSFALLKGLWDGKFHAMNWCCIMPCSAQVVAAKCCKTVQFCANILWLRDSNTAWPKYCTQMLSHRRMLIYRDAFIQGCFYTEKLFTQTCFDTDVYTYRCFYSEMLLRAATMMHRCFYTGMLLHKGTFAHRHAGASTHRRLYTAMLLHTGVFTHMCFYTGNLSTQSILYTEKKLHKYSYAVFSKRKYIYTEAFLKHRQYTDTFTKKCFARIPLHRDAFTHRRF